MADEVIKKQTCPDCGKLAMYESSGITVCGACGQFGGQVINDFEKLLGEQTTEAQKKIDSNQKPNNH